MEYDVATYAPYKVAETKSQKDSLAELPLAKKYALYEEISEENLHNYHRISCRPITVTAENDMELVSDIVTWGERYRHHWESGIYHCSRCLAPLYSSEDKWNGPCVWPSFRKPVTNDSNESYTANALVYPYNSYTTTVVKEVYCGKCDLFIGHCFDDGKVKGDSHPEALWRH